MNEAKSRRSVRPRFSLLNLLTLTALIAIGTACGTAYRKNRSMVQQRDELLSLSSRLQVDGMDELALSKMPRVANDFQSWNVHVPTGQDFELRLGMGGVSQKGIPPIVGSMQIPAGRHRVTLHTGDSPRDEFRYVVYVDGKQAIEKTMGSDWMPGGWSSARSISWPREPRLTPAPLQLYARSYKPNLDFGKGNHFRAQSDNYVTRKGYRLWIDLSDRSYQPASPFMGFLYDPKDRGIGLRDGLRYKPSSSSPYEWTFTRPNLSTNDPVMRVSAEFFASDGTILSSATQSFHSWQLSNDARGERALSWQAAPAQSGYSAFLQAKFKSGDLSQPVVQMKWEAGRPDEVGLRIADTPANDRVSRWRLRILDGTNHLWRELQIGDKTINAAEAIDQDADESPEATVSLDLGNNVTEDIRVQWQTNETLPLQILERRQKRYSGMGLYQGLPVTLGIQIPPTLNAALTAKVVQKAPNESGNVFPGGPVFDEIRLDLEAVEREWIWLTAQPQM